MCSSRVVSPPELELGMEETREGWGALTGPEIALPEPGAPQVGLCGSLASLGHACWTDALLCQWTPPPTHFMQLFSTLVER